MKALDLNQIIQGEDRVCVWGGGETTKKPRELEMTPGVKLIFQVQEEKELSKM